MVTESIIFQYNEGFGLTIAQPHYLDINTPKDPFTQAIFAAIVLLLAHAIKWIDYINQFLSFNHVTFCLKFRFPDGGQAK